MSCSPRRRVRAALITFTLAAALGVTTLPALSASAPAAPAAAAAPDAAGSASGFLFYVIPDPQPTCVVPVGLNATADPSIDRSACAFAEFQVSGATGAVTADLYADDAATPFATDLPA